MAQGSARNLPIRLAHRGSGVVISIPTTDPTQAVKTFESMIVRGWSPGWGVYNDNEIQKDDELSIVASDADAWEEVWWLAQHGSGVAMDALSAIRERYSPSLGDPFDTRDPQYHAIGDWGRLSRHCEEVLGSLEDVGVL